MLKVGLTGGIGCGKSTAIGAFRVLGVAVIDADQIAKNLVKPGKEAFNAIYKKFGDEFLHQQGTKKGELNRALLKEKVFSDELALSQLEDILHPRVKKEIKQKIALLEIKEPGQKQPPYVVVDVPLLLEKAYQDMFDRIVVVDCLPDQQIERVKQRDGLAGHLIKDIMKKQISREARLEKATDIILNSSNNKNALFEQINRLHLQFLALT